MTKILIRRIKEKFVDRRKIEEREREKRKFNVSKYDQLVKVKLTIKKHTMVDRQTAKTRYIISIKCLIEGYTKIESIHIYRCTDRERDKGKDLSTFTPTAFALVLTLLLFTFGPTTSKKSIKIRDKKR